FSRDTNAHGDQPTPLYRSTGESTFSAMPLAKDLASHLAANRDRSLDELFEFLRIPSVSARSEHNADTVRAADWFAASLGSIGLKATIHPTKGHPIVVGEWRGAPGAQTVLVYGHYDVQPAEPLDLWDSPPFQPTLRDGKIFARTPAVQAAPQRGKDLRPRLGRRQRPALLARQGAPGTSGDTRQAAGERHGA